MSIKTLTKDRFTFIAYKRENFGDYVELKKTVDGLTSQEHTSDIAIDFTPCISILENEMAIIASTIKKLLPTKRCLHLITKEADLKKLRQNHIMSFENVKVYENHSEFLNDVNRTEGTNRDAGAGEEGNKRDAGG
jgi:hypothetical protein